MFMIGMDMVLLGVDLVDILWNPGTSYEKSIFYFWMFGGCFWVLALDLDYLDVEVFLRYYSGVIV